MVRKLILKLVLVLGVLVAACASKPERETAPPSARIAEDVALTLPLPPAYPDSRTIVQTGRAHYGERQAAFEAVLTLSPERVEIVLTMLGGPRLSTITWDGTGVREERSPFAPDNVPVENILADIFVATWPAEAVRASLPEGVSLDVSPEGVRTLRRGDRLIETVTPDVSNLARTLVRNEAFGYEVSLTSQSLD